MPYQLEPDGTVNEADHVVTILAARDAALLGLADMADQDVMLLWRAAKHSTTKLPGVPIPALQEQTIEGFAGRMLDFLEQYAVHLDRVHLTD